MNSIIALTATGILAMVSEILRFKRGVLYPLVLVGLIVAFGLSVYEWDTDISYYNDMLRFDNYAIGFSSLIIAITLLWFVLSKSFVSQPARQSDFTSLICFASAGAIVMVSHADITMLFIGLEILSIAMYVMSSSSKTDIKSNESGFKYFIMGAFATGFLLFGIALIYGVTGSFNLSVINRQLSGYATDIPILAQAGLLFIIVGLGFKVAAAPLHFWAPDVYEGAPAPVTAYMSTIVKIGAFGAFFRLFSTSFGSLHEFWSPVVAALAVMSILGGNILAVYQLSLKRMLAYSSIAHAGYMLLALVSLKGDAAVSLLFYLTAYSVASIGLFTIVLSIADGNNEKISALNGYARLHKKTSFGIVVLTLSMAGIPPVAGFFAKYFIFTTAVMSGYTWLVLLGVLGSLIGVYYYFRIIIALFKPADRSSLTFRLPISRQLVLWICVICTILIGLFPGFFTTLN